MLKCTPRLLRERVAGIDFAKALLERAQDEHLRVFLLGGKEGVAARAKEQLLHTYPSLCICGVHHGYFQKDGCYTQPCITAVRVLTKLFALPHGESFARLFQKAPPAAGLRSFCTASILSPMFAQPTVKVLPAFFKRRHGSNAVERWSRSAEREIPFMRFFLLTFSLRLHRQRKSG